MASHENPSSGDEWYTPAWIFDALAVTFDLDPCMTHDWRAMRNIMGHDAHCEHYLTKQEDGLTHPWSGSVWLNPPFGGRNGIRPWLEKLAAHGDGITLVPNRTGADWWQDFAQQADGLLFVRGKIRFLRPDGSEGASPGHGNVLMAFGRKMAGALKSSAIRGVRA